LIVLIVFHQFLLPPTEKLLPHLWCNADLIGSIVNPLSST